MATIIDHRDIAIFRCLHEASKSHNIHVLKTLSYKKSSHAEGFPIDYATCKKKFLGLLTPDLNETVVKPHRWILTDWINWQNTMYKYNNVTHKITSMNDPTFRFKG